MKFSFLVLLALAWAGPGCTSKPGNDPRKTVTILTYSTLGSKGGFLKKVQEEFQTQSGCTLNIETTLGAAQVLSYLEEPKQQAYVDVVMGIDEILFGRAKDYFYPASPVTVKYQPLIAPHAQAGFYPTDHAALSMIYKKSELKAPPRKLTDLLKPEFKKKFIVQDPRVSSPGMWFFLFTDQIVKTQDLAKQWLAVSPSWDASYKMFIAGEAPMVWSYLTSLAYHASKGEGDKYGYVDFQEGLPLQIEGLAVVKKSVNPYDAKPCVKQWVEFVLKPENQTKLSDAQWMMPAVEGAAVPKFLSMVPTPKKAAVLDISIDKVDDIVSHFGRAVQN
ncbi:MAG: thiamine ABC transporter substrate-binding protein [Bdellovibrionales bacterium]|nr:thiamine ABC transporter substrate-binding protein [Bdellovibrionales bacterium]